MYSIIIVALLLIFNCSNLQIIPEPTLDLVSIKSESFCPTWNWHPFCIESKPNSFHFRGTINNTTSEKRIFIDYYLDSFDTDIPVGLSVKINGTYFVLKKNLTDYSDALKLRSEVSEDIVKLISSTNEPLSLSYSNRKSSINFDFSNRESEKIKSLLKSVVDNLNSMQKMKVVR